MPTDPTRGHRGPDKDRFRAARRAKARTERKARGPQLFFPWFAEIVATSTKDPAPAKIGRAAT
jgi:hypothetical protein